MSMNGKLVVVAGGGRDIGKACALDFAKQGANVVLTYNSSKETAQEVAATTESLGSRAFAIQADLTNEAEINKVITYAADTFGKIDTLVHVAGGLLARVKITEMTNEHWDNVANVNLKSLFICL